MSVYPAALPTVRPAVRSAFEQGSGGGAASIIAGLFSAGQQGFWLPFTDFASLSQDSAGTLPYTELEQPVGRVLDRSGRGNHATQPTSTARGVVSARVNLLVKSEDFADANWSKWGGAFAGTKFTEDATAGAAHFVQQYNVAFAANSTISFKARLSGVGRDWCLLWDTVNNRRAWFNLATGAAGGTLGGATAAITPAGVGVYDCEMVFTNPTAAINLRIALAPSDGTTFYDGDGVSGINIFRASVALASQSSLPYQCVNTPTDYDSIDFPKYLRLDGTDDFYTCGGGGSTTGFYYSDVVRPMGGAGTRRVIWSDRSGNNGYELAINTSDKLEFSAGNGTAITTVASTVSATVAEGKRYEVMDDGTNLSVQIDGSAPVTVARPVVTAGSSTITLYRGASTGYFNGQITEPIYRAGPPPSAYEREVIRNYQMQKAGML